MGIIATFKKALKLRLEQLKGESFIGTSIYWRGKLRKVVKEDLNNIWVRGIKEAISKESLKNHKKYARR